MKHLKKEKKERNNQNVYSEQCQYLQASCLASTRCRLFDNQTCDKCYGEDGLETDSTLKKT